jgi:type IVB pilus formation R64 PilN family outer membrane protein
MKFTKNLILLSFALAGFGCSTTHTEKYEKAYKNTEDSFEGEYKSRLKQATPVQDNIGQEHKGFYVDVDSYFIERQEEEVLPVEFNVYTALSFEKDKDVNIAAAKIFSKSGIKVEFIIDAGSFEDKAASENAVSAVPQLGVGADSTGGFQVPLSNTGFPQEDEGHKLKEMSFEGTLRETLDYIGVINNLKWKYDETSDKVFFFEQSIETFYIYEQAVQIKTDNKISTSTDASGEGSKLGNDQKISFTKDEDAWGDIEAEIKSMLSGKGKIAFNKRQGSVVIQDNDFVLSKIRDRIEKINHEAKRTVTVDFSIVNVKMDDSNNIGVNWSYVNDSLKSSLLGGFDLTAGLGQAAPSLGGSELGGMSSLLPLYKGNYYGIQTNDNFNVLLGMLNEIGSVNINSRTTFPTLNNHPMSFQITKNEDYVSSIDREKNSETGDENISTEIDTIKDGITLTVTPRIIGEEVRLEYTMSLNVNDGLVQAPGIDGVQLPKESNKDFSQSIIAQNGQTTVVMAFQKQDTKTATQGPFSDTLWFVGGSEGYSTNKEIVVITATPYFEIK